MWRHASITTVSMLHFLNMMSSEKPTRFKNGRVPNTVGYSLHFKSCPFSVSSISECSIVSALSPWQLSFRIRRSSVSFSSLKARRISPSPHCLAFRYHAFEAHRPPRYVTPQEVMMTSVISTVSCLSSPQLNSGTISSASPNP